MSKTAQKKTSSTQKFTDIQDISEDVVFLLGGNACLIIEVQAVNFTLLSKAEQDAKLFGYAAFLNSLSFSVQIVVKNRRIDISSYITLLNQEAAKPRDNQLLITHINLYRDFVQELVKVNTVLDKKFYVVVPYSPLELGVSGAVKGKEGALGSAKAALRSKAQSAHAQLARLNLRAKTLEKEELVRLFYDMYNPNQNIGSPSQFSAPIIVGGTNA